MKTLILLTSLFSGELLKADAFIGRPRKIKASYDSLEGAETIRFAYDKIGNINSVSTFAANGDLTESEYFFYSEGCARKIRKYRSGRLVATSKLLKDSKCRTLQITEYDKDGKILYVRKNTFFNDVLISFAEYDAEENKIAHGTYVYEDGHLMRIESSDKTARHILTYKYSPGYIFSYVKHEIIGHEGPKVSGKMIFTFEEGPITNESLRVFFE